MLRFIRLFQGCFFSSYVIFTISVALDIFFKFFLYCTTGVQQNFTFDKMNIYKMEFFKMVVTEVVQRLHVLERKIVQRMEQLKPGKIL